jgi:hypothetical protein
VVERCPDKTEVDGPIPSTLTFFLWYNFPMEEFKNQEGISDDMKLALSFVGHIKGPCEDLHGNNVRDFWVREAKKVLGTMQDKVAKDILEAAIREYS